MTVEIFKISRYLFALILIIFMSIIQSYLGRCPVYQGSGELYGGSPGRARPLTNAPPPRRQLEAKAHEPSDLLECLSRRGRGPVRPIATERDPQCPLDVCAVTRRRFPVGASPTRRTLQPEATGAVMEVTKWLKPSV